MSDQLICGLIGTGRIGRFHAESPAAAESVLTGAPVALADAVRS